MQIAFAFESLFLAGFVIYEEEFISTAIGFTSHG